MADGPRIGLVETEAVSCVHYELQIKINVCSDSVQSKKKKRKTQNCHFIALNLFPVSPSINLSLIPAR